MNGDYRRGLGWEGACICVNQTKGGGGTNVKRERATSSGVRSLPLMRASGGQRCSDGNQRVPGDAWLKETSQVKSASKKGSHEAAYHRRAARTRQRLPHQNRKRHRLW